MPVILGKRAVLDGPSRDALQPKLDWSRMMHAFIGGSHEGRGVPKYARGKVVELVRLLEI
jgi:hypothetical protein